MNKLYIILIITFASLNAQAQQPDYNPYSPVDFSTKDWTYAAHAFYNNHNNSNSLSNEFSKAYNNSEYLSKELKDQQMSQLGESVKVGRVYRGELGAWFKSRKEQNSPFFYVGVDFQEVLDGQVDKDFVGLVLYGNKHYAGQQVDISNTEYTNDYFNRVKFGMGKAFGNGEIVHTLSAVLGLTIGQNHDYLKVNNAGLFTQEDGDYIDVSIQAETKLADTVWGSLFTVNGLGASADLHYSMYKEKDFFLAINFQNLGFVNWNGGPFTATADTSFRFDGLANDSTNQEQIPNDFSKSGLRNLIFKNPGHSSFTEGLPLNINFTAGKYFSDGKFYIGINTDFYPSLISTYRAELFGTWNIQEKYQITPIVSYSSFGQMNIGLALGAQLWDSVSIRMGSSYLNSMFNPNANAAQGGFISLVFFH